MLNWHIFTLLSEKDLAIPSKSQAPTTENSIKNVLKELVTRACHILNHSFATMSLCIQMHKLCDTTRDTI